MGVFDKIKNALFEVEYVEVEEKPKKEKKHKEKKSKDKINDEKPIAKKIVLPGKKEEKVKRIEEEDLKDEDFEIRPKDETVKEQDKETNSFKFMDDEDFTVEEEPKIVEVYDNDTFKEEPKDITEELFEEKRPVYSGESKKENHHDYHEEKPHVIKDDYKIKQKSSKPYGMDDSYKVEMHEYGTYEKKEDKTYFKPSPIISPIYGILDKNYKKEDVVSKKEIRITSNYSRSNVNVDDIRNKAFGRRSSEVKKEEETAFEIDEEEDNLMVDLSDEKDKPEVKQVTVGDAMEYFQDLGLEYNVDYVDATKEKEKSKEKETKTEKAKDKLKTTKDEKTESKKIETPDDEIPEIKEKKVVVEDEKKSDTKIDDDDDNLFDLIDSMYKEED